MIHAIGAVTRVQRSTDGHSNSLVSEGETRDHPRHPGVISFDIAAALDERFSPWA
jgi:hypothetical protein